MPLSKYDRYFGGKSGSARKALRSMRKTYKSPEKAESVFYATKNKHKAESGPGGMHVGMK